jgi:hypothetical protein
MQNIPFMRKNEGVRKKGRGLRLRFQLALLKAMRAAALQEENRSYRYQVTMGGTIEVQ